jgi:hypothetical protein
MGADRSTGVMVGVGGTGVSVGGIGLLGGVQEFSNNRAASRIYILIFIFCLLILNYIL